MARIACMVLLTDYSRTELINLVGHPRELADAVELLMAAFRPSIETVYGGLHIDDVNFRCGVQGSGHNRRAISGNGPQMAIGTLY